MTQPNSLELAKQGDPQAIASLMNRSLQPKGLTAKAEWVGERLQVLLEADQIPNRQVLTNFVQIGLQKLGIPAIQTVEILGKQTSADAPAWSEEITLAAPPASLTQPVMPPPVPQRAVPVPPPLPRNPNIVVSEAPVNPVVEPEVPSVVEDSPRADLGPALDQSDALDNEDEDDSSTLLASMTFTRGDLEPESSPQFDELAADLEAVPLDDEPGLRDTPEDLRGEFADEFTESDRPAPGGFVLPGVVGNELPTVTDSLPLEALQDFENLPLEPQDSDPLLAPEDEADPLFDEGNQNIYLPSSDLDDLETNGNTPPSDRVIGDELDPDEPQFFSPDEDIYSENEPIYPSEPVVEYVNDPTTESEGYVDGEEEELSAASNDDEEFVEERGGLPATGWFAAGLLGILVFGLLGYSLFSSSLGGTSLISRIFGLSSDEPSPPAASVTPLPTATESAVTSPSPTAANTAPLQAASALELKIAGLEAAAQSADDWNLIAGQWQAAIALLQQVPANSPDGAAAQQKLAQYQQKLAAAQQKASLPAAANTPSSTTTTTIAGNVACQAVSSQPDSQPVELTNLQIQSGQSGNVMVGCLTNHTDQAIAQVSVSYEALSNQDPSLAQGGLSQIASTPLQPRETVPFTGSFTLNPDLNSVKIESIFWTPAGTQEPQRIPTELVLTP